MLQKTSYFLLFLPEYPTGKWERPSDDGLLRRIPTWTQWRLVSEKESITWLTVFRGSTTQNLGIGVSVEIPTPQSDGVGVSLGIFDIENVGVNGLRYFDIENAGVDGISYFDIENVGLNGI